MELFPVGAAGLLIVVSFIVGSLPVIAWMVQGLARKRLTDLGTGNISVSAAFYHGGTKVGLLAVASEAAKGIFVVLLARSLFENAVSWEIIALVALVMGRYFVARGAGTTNVVWGYIAHDWVIAATIFVLSISFFAVFRRRSAARLFVLALIPVVEALRHPDHPAAIAAAALLALLIAVIYATLPDDLALSSQSASNSSKNKMFQYLKGRDVIKSLNDKPDIAHMGRKAATLAALKQCGYAVPMGWTLPLNASGRSLLQHLETVEAAPWQQRWIVRSSAPDEDSLEISGAGQYDSIADVQTAAELEQAIEQCRASYRNMGATQYRRDRGLAGASGISVLVQKQVSGVYSGVAFSRDPVEPGEAVIVEALAGGADQVVSGQVTPEQHRIQVDETSLAHIPPADLGTCDRAALTSDEHDGIPPALIHQVARLARHLELHYHGIPQDIEWSYDGDTLWLLQARPITTLSPLWTRKIAAEVIPGVIRPLTWSINRPLTCGVWGDIFTIVLGSRAEGLDFGETATLHYSRAYFNATLLGQIFRRMGLPPESLEFLTFGAKFSKPPIFSTLKNIPGLLRLAAREWNLIPEFTQDDQTLFVPTLEYLRQNPPRSQSVPDLLNRTELILARLKQVTYYNILAPLSFSLRRSLFQVSETDLDASQQPEVASVRAVKTLAQAVRQQFPELTERSMGDRATTALLEKLKTTPAGTTRLRDLEAIVERYGFLSEVGTDISVPTWQEDPSSVHELFAQFVLNPPPEPEKTDAEKESGTSGWRRRQVQRRLNLKGRVAKVYLTLLAELRWSLLALEERAIAEGRLLQTGDGFFLTYDELRAGMATSPQLSAEDMQRRIAERRSQFELHQGFASVPFVVYGNDPPPNPVSEPSRQSLKAGILQGIGASAGQIEGPVRVLRSINLSESLAPNTIIVVPYTDAGWAPILAQAAGLVAEVGGRLSHGAIVAREYRIPAVMNIPNATQQFSDGQWLRIDGRAGTVEVLPPSENHLV